MLIASGKVKAHLAAIVALIVPNIITIAIFTMPAGMSIRAALLGFVVGFFPIGWIVLKVNFSLPHHRRAIDRRRLDRDQPAPRDFLVRGSL